MRTKSIHKLHTRMVMVAQDVVGQSKREKAQSLEGKVFHDYGIGALDLSRTSVLIQFILTSVPTAC